MTGPGLTLHRIVRVLGGDLYQGGLRANVPAPGHSPHDRSISLLISGGRVVVHGFGGTDWREALDDLRDKDLVDGQGRPTGCAGQSVSYAATAFKRDAAERKAVARHLWSGAMPLGPGSLSAAYLKGRRVRCDLGVLCDLRHHPAAPLAVYGPAGATRAALIAAIRGPDGDLAAVELTYLGPNGHRALGLRLSRKTVGVVPMGSAVRLMAAGPELLVGEGLVTTLSAMARFDLPGWSLMCVRNLSGWSAPPGVRRVVIAGDRGRPGEGAAQRLRRHLGAQGVAAEIVLPEPPYGDWNEAALP